MNNQLSIGDFLAHAIVLEADAASCYSELAAAMDVHNNRAIAALFQQMAGCTQNHLSIIEHMIALHDISNFNSLELSWHGSIKSPEFLEIEDTHYLMTARQALEIALQAEERAYGYYESVRALAEDSDLRNLATKLAAEEGEHVRFVSTWLGRTLQKSASWFL